ncbi:signal peptidase I [Microbacterium sp. ASV81]|uniref:Signal peptidase I n=1 Tax=Microbacterium capsulatum TaxID=3041921 RepID=A0ABU0XBI6_9MICO|nr:signal peptidase I [Microbacterium sp. ASV81]MDQ4212474.1 signal peptidase I [Microbacterium sp. ASV81]
MFLARAGDRPFPISTPTDGRRLRRTAGAPRGLRRALSFAVRWVPAALVVAGVIGYFALAVVNQASPPLVAVSGRSMTPTIVTGELVVLHGVQPADLKVGDVIAVIVPAADQKQYDLPSHVVHRIVKIENTPAGRVFATKGDGNSGNDVFQTFPSGVVGKVVGHVPYLGYPILFASSPQGMIFLGAVALVVLLYFLLGLLEGRRSRQEGTAQAMRALAEDIAELKLLLSPSADRPGDPPPPAPGEGSAVRDLAASVARLDAVVRELAARVTHADEPGASEPADSRENSVV